MDQLVYMPFLVSIIAIVVLVGLPILTWILFRLLAHRERIEMIRHGITPGGVAQGARAAQYGDAADATANLQLRRGVSVTFIGLALTIGLSFIGFDDGRVTYGPWLLGGLIPLFVGLAQIINAVINGARFGATRAGSYGGASSIDAGPQSLYEAQRSESQKRPPV